MNFYPYLLCLIRQTLSSTRAFALPWENYSLSSDRAPLKESKDE